MHLVEGKKKDKKRCDSYYLINPSMAQGYLICWKIINKSSSGE